MNFVTYGPFELDEWSPEGIDALYEKFEAKQKGLKFSVGVYIVGCIENGVLKPWYVGKSDKNMGGRVFKHFNAFLEDLYKKNGNLQFFLIPHITKQGRLKKSSKNGYRKAIDRLEFALIGSCLGCNPKLLNKQEVTFHSNMKVPGYWNSPSTEHDSSAKALAKMLRTKS